MNTLIKSFVCSVEMREGLPLLTVTRLAANSKLHAGVDDGVDVGLPHRTKLLPGQTVISGASELLLSLGAGPCVCTARICVAPPCAPPAQWMQRRYSRFIFAQVNRATRSQPRNLQAKDATGQVDLLWFQLADNEHGVKRRVTDLQVMRRAGVRQ